MGMLTSKPPTTSSGAIDFALAKASDADQIVIAAFVAVLIPIHNQGTITIDDAQNV